MPEQLTYLHDQPSNEGPNWERMLHAGDVLALGGGVQSTAMCYMIYEGVLPKPDLIVMADTGDEPPWVYETVLKRVGPLMESINVPVVMPQRILRDDFFVDRNNRTYRDYSRSMMDDIVHGRVTTSLPVFTWNPKTKTRGRLRRNCTSDVKVSASNRVIRSWLAGQGFARKVSGSKEIAPAGWHVITNDKELIVPRTEGPVVVDSNYESYTGHHRVMAGTYVNLWFGMTTDEKYRVDPARGTNWQRAVYPLVDMDMSRRDVVNWLREHNYPVPLKSACIYCPYRSDMSWLWFQRHAPDEFEVACVADDQLRFHLLTDEEVIHWAEQYGSDKDKADAAEARLPQNQEMVYDQGFAWWQFNARSIRTRNQIGFYHSRGNGGMKDIRDEMYIHRLCQPLRHIDFEALVKGDLDDSHIEHDMAGALLMDQCDISGSWSCFA
ncbi:MAG: hypothetical protein AAF125_01385 [Chloroflexota bacterium]